MTLGPRCGGCALKNSGGYGYVIEDGAGELKVAMIAEAPGEDEVPAKRPLVGKAGKVLDRIVERTPWKDRKLKRDDFWYTNIVRCQPPGNVLTGAHYEEAAISQCAPYLMEWLGKKKPKAIVALGNQALRWLTGHWGIEKLRGYIWDTRWGPVVGTYHPSYILRGKWNLAKIVQLDIVRALEVAEKGKPTFEKNYILRPSPMEVLQYVTQYEMELKRCPTVPLIFDIETPHSSFGKDEEIDPELEEIAIEDDKSYTVLRISFSFRPGEAITFPWMPPYTDYAKRLLASAGPKGGWNFLNFDIPRLEANGAPVRGRLYDGMDMFHFIEPALPMGLKYAATIYTPDMPPWKLKAHEEPEWYSAADSDVTRRCIIKMMQHLASVGRMATFERHFVDLALVLRKMGQRGVLVNREQRRKDLEEFETQRSAAVEALQSRVPDTVKPKHQYKLTKAQLEKRGLWVEGRMVEWS